MPGRTGFILPRSGSRTTAGATSRRRFARFYGNLGWKDADAEVHLVASEADNFFGMIGPNQAQLLAVNGRYSGTAYMRKFQQGSLLFNMLFRSD
jgi:hypothetical protein